MYNIELQVISYIYIISNIFRTIHRTCYMVTDDVIHKFTAVVSLFVILLLNIEYNRVYLNWTDSKPGETERDRERTK